MIYHTALLFGVLTFTHLFSILQPVSANQCGKAMSWTGGSNTFDSEQVTNELTLYNNVFGTASTAPGSSQSVQCVSTRGRVVSWTTSFDFRSKTPSVDYEVKSYGNLVWAGRPIRISTLRKFAVGWSWSLSGQSSDMTMNVSLDIFTSRDPNCSGQSGHCAAHEIMVWLAYAGGAGPAGTSTGKTVSVGNYEFVVFKWPGNNNGAPIISLFPAGGKTYPKFTANLIPVLTRELYQFGVRNNEYIVTVGSGSEVFKGRGTLKTNAYLLSLA